MRLLLDTHIALWAFADAPQLSEHVRQLIADAENDVYASVVSSWEISIKHLSHPDEMLYSGEAFTKTCERVGFRMLRLKEQHVAMYDALDLDKAHGRHKDPFDRMLIAQSRAENMLLLTHDAAFSLYGEPTVQVV